MFFEIKSLLRDVKKLLPVVVADPVGQLKTLYPQRTATQKSLCLLALGKGGGDSSASLKLVMQWIATTDPLMDKYYSQLTSEYQQYFARAERMRNTYKSNCAWLVKNAKIWARKGGASSEDASSSSDTDDDTTSLLKKQGP
jgi:hypothetical protein